MDKVIKNNLYGILWILANNFTMAIQTATIKTLSNTMPSVQVVFLYKLTVFFFVLIWVCFKGFKSVKTKKLHLHFLRAALSMTAAMIFVSALHHLPLIDAMAVGYTEPLIVSILAVVLLKEYINAHMIFAAIIGFIGVLIVLQPGTDTFNNYALWVLVAAFVWAFDNIVIKFLGKTENSIQYLFYISFFSSLLGFPLAYKVWAPVQQWQIPWIFALAIFYFVHLIAVFKAFQFANLSVVAPFDFSRLLFSTAIGAIIFGDKVDMTKIFGGLVIVSSTAYIIWKKEHPVPATT